MPQSITAARLRLILSSTLILIVLAGGGIFYLGYSQLSKIASEAGEKAATAKQSETTIQRLESTQKELEQKKDIVFRASQVTADSQNYAYQDRLVNDLTVYASRANLSITNISFSSQASGPTVPAPATGNLEGSAGTATPETGLASGASLKKATVDITLASPLNYRDLLNFLHYIEQNLTKLKVSRVSMTKSEGENVTIDVLNLEVYLK